MKEQITEYVISLYRDIPMAVSEGLLSVLCLGAVVIFAYYGLKRGWRGIAGLLLVEYIFLIYCSTVICRSVIDDEKYDRAQLTPFWSYNKPELFVESVINIVMFVPVGVLLGCACKSIKWWQVLLVGAGISASIEALQFLTGKGFTETDDVMHNTLGCMIGITLANIPMFMIRKLKKQ